MFLVKNKSQAFSDSSSLSSTNYMMQHLTCYCSRLPHRCRCSSWISVNILGEKNGMKLLPLCSASLLCGMINDQLQIKNHIWCQWLLATVSGCASSNSRVLWQTDYSQGALRLAAGKTFLCISQSHSLTSNTESLVTKVSSTRLYHASPPKAVVNYYDEKVEVHIYTEPQEFNLIDK